MARRLVGIDLGIASSHTVRVLDETGQQVCRRRCEPTVASLTRIEDAASVGAPPGTVLEVVLEPTGACLAAGGGVLRFSGPPRLSCLKRQVRGPAAVPVQACQ